MLIAPTRRHHRIALLASARYPLRQPWAGGLEAFTWQLADRLRRRGHEVTIFAGAGSDRDFGVREMPRLPDLSRHARQDVSMPAEWFIAEHHSYLALMLELGRDDDFDVVHNNSLHYLPIAMADQLGVPLLTTLHTPPTAWLQSAIAAGRRSDVHYAAVSRATASYWAPIVPGPITVVNNGVDLDAWQPGLGGGPPVWFGRLVAEKGPDHAIAAARRAGTGLRLAGPCPDQVFFDAEVRPHLGGPIEYLGHLGHPELQVLLGEASVSVTTPRWDEPFGLTVAEAFAAGTPVAAYRRGALSDLVTAATGRLADPDDIDDLANAVTGAMALDRAAVRRSAEERWDLGRMVTGYEQIYSDLGG